MNGPSDPNLFTRAQATNDALPHWSAAVSQLLSSRVAIFQAEAQGAVSSIVKKIVGLIALMLFALFAWTLLLAGAVGALAIAFGFSWYWIALVLCALHIVAAVAISMLVKKPLANISFPVTRSEFQKDSQWISNFQHHQKSPD